MQGIHIINYSLPENKALPCAWALPCAKKARNTAKIPLGCVQGKGARQKHQATHGEKQQHVKDMKHTWQRYHTTHIWNRHTAT
jgi:hypothetical protein